MLKAAHSWYVLLNLLLGTQHLAKYSIGLDVHIVHGFFRLWSSCTACHSTDMDTNEDSLWSFSQGAVCNYR